LFSFQAASRKQLQLPAEGDSFNEDVEFRERAEMVEVRLQ